MGKTSAPPLNGEAIKQARLRRFMTQAEVAEQCVALGVKFDRSGLSLIESGFVKRPSLKVVRALGEVLGMDTDELFADEDDEAEPEGKAAA